jgi:hypothetical protein
MLLGSGLGTIDQTDPFHDSIRDGPESDGRYPTAKQSLALTHETPRSWFGASATSGLGVTDQFVPFQVSTSVSMTSDALT